MGIIKDILNIERDWITGKYFEDAKINRIIYEGAQKVYGSGDGSNKKLSYAGQLELERRKRGW